MVSLPVSTTGIALSCAVGVGVFAWAYATTTPRKGEEAGDLLLSARIAALISGVFAILAFIFAAVFSGAEPADVLLADAQGRQLRKAVYFAYGALTVSLLFFIAFGIHKFRRQRGAR